MRDPHEKHDARVIDLRSDTVTRPTEAMRQAMFDAPVGDDVYREDPSAAALEARAAELTGMEAALFMPTGSMGNQVAMATWAGRHQSVLCERRAHVLLYEQGAMAALSGLHPEPLMGDAQGCLDPEDVARALRPAPYYRVPVGLVAVECTHNVAGGTLPDLDKLAEVRRVARDHGLPVHMDGARLFNAAAAYGVPASEVAAHADSVMFCLSKGLGAPVGSMLCGPRDFIERALPMRKRFGGGMRQVGIMCAAGLHALDHHIDRLADDHANARALANGLDAIDGLSIDPDAFPTNILYVTTAPEAAARWSDALRDRGVLAHALAHDRVRFVTHLDVPEDAIPEVLSRAADAAAEVAAG